MLHRRATDGCCRGGPTSGKLGFRFCNGPLVGPNLDKSSRLIFFSRWQVERLARQVESVPEVGLSRPPVRLIVD
jgi:hypothetical protein